MTLPNSTAIALISTLAAAPGLAQTANQTVIDETTNPALSEAEVIDLADWNYDTMYASSISAENFIDEMEIYGQDGNEIGNIEDLLIDPDGRVIAIIAEVGGFWDIGDTHVSIPFDQAQVSDDGEGLIVPVTEETIDDYGFFDDAERGPDQAEGDVVGSEVVVGVDDAALPRAWRASELIGDFARVGEGDERTNYGYVNDIILSDGQVTAVVVQPASAFGGGFRPYPYQNYDNGWNPGSQNYDMPYTEQQAGEVEQFDYERLGNP